MKFATQISPLLNLKYKDTTIARLLIEIYMLFCPQVNPWCFVGILLILLQVFSDLTFKVDQNIHPNREE